MKKQSGIYVTVLACTAMAQGAAAFEAEEATIAGMQSAIRAGEVTCKGVVEAHLARARAYNGVCTALITADGASIKPVKGYLRAGKALEFPTRTVAASRVFPDLDKYQGLPLELGRMEKSISDPGVWQQQGMRVGIADAGQINALETLNVRGERSVTCKGKFDIHPSQGPLPAGAPAVCEKFRQQPDALERAAELDAQYGSNPDLAKLPMYCVIASFKDPYDTKDMRTTSNNDVNFAMDVPPADSTLVAQLRAKGAIIYAKSVAHEFNGGPGDPGGSNKAKFNWVAGGQMTSGWSGQPCNPYDTERVVRGSSGGSGAAVGGNLAMIGICEQSGASCQGPASRNGTAMILTTKGIIPDNGGIGNQWFNDRAGIHARTLVDAAKVLDAMKDPERGYHDPRDPFTALPKALIPAEPYASFLVGDAAVKGGKPLKGMRIAILREHMATPTKNHEAISAQIDAEIKKVLRDQLGAELVETVTPKYPDDPSIANIAYGFQDALAELLPRFMPEVFTRRDKDGTLFFDVPGHDVTSYDYLMKLSNRKAPLTSKVDITNFANFSQTPCMTGLCSDTVFDLDRYLLARGDSRITNWAAWVGNAKFKTDESAAGARNWVDFKDHNAPGKAERLARSQIGRMALQRVMNENHIDAFVHAENTVPTPKIQGPNVGTNSLDGITPFFQIPRIVIPAGVTTVVYEPVYALNADRTDYISVLPDNVQVGKLPKPMPIAITLFSGQGEESTLLRIGSAYEAATHHRFAPPDFGPVKR